jgi:cellulose synthase/poly-beta-1,6-N-acetylglucosamine synthase-like glycosyltransferase
MSKNSIGKITALMIALGTGCATYTPAILLPLTAYLLLLTICSAPPRPRSRRKKPTTRFRFVVPAHDEQSSIGKTVQSLLATDYPPDLREVVVVADNCTDDTAARAAAAGARVLERQDPARRGKGFALEMAFDAADAEGFDGVLVIVDADTEVTPNLLAAMDRRIADGAQVLQARYGVSNPLASWRTELMTIAFAMFQDLRSIARERLGLSCGLRGNGMAFTAEARRLCPHRAHGLVEDVEHGIALGLAGVRVGYVHEASVLGEMPTTGRAAASQRQRWEGGRAGLMKTHVPKLLRQVVRTRSGVALDLALDLITPPLSRLGLGMALWLGIEAGFRFATGAFTPTAPLWLFSAGALVLYVGRGVALSGLGFRSLFTLARAPIYVLWKITGVSSRPTGQWVRTPREADARRTTASALARAVGGRPLQLSVEQVVIDELHDRLRSALGAGR